MRHSRKAMPHFSCVRSKPLYFGFNLDYNVKNEIFGYRKECMDMKSVKPGRGPSMMGGISSLFAVGFGVFWTIQAVQKELSMAIFGVLWTGLAISSAVYNLKNAVGKNRHSDYDITDASEEPDPLNERFGNAQTTTQKSYSTDNRFCPYCGTVVADDFEFCNRCGRKLP